MTAQESGHDVTQLLRRWHDGDSAALDRLLPLVYADLRRLAAAQLRGRSGHTTMQTTALVHDVLLRLLERPAIELNDSKHLLNAAARMMRQLLVDRLRAATTDKRGGGWRRDDFCAALELPIPDDTDLAELDRALHDLETVQPRMARVVELRYFIGLEMTEIAAAIGVTPRTAQRDWAMARAWLQARLSAG